MRFETGTVNIELGEQKFDTQYQKKIYETMEDILSESQGDGDKLTPEKAQLSIVKRINMAEDWERRTAARSEFLKDGDAAKAVSLEKNIKAFMNAREKAGKPITEAEARRKVLVMMED